MIELIILTILMVGPRHGYEIKKLIQSMNVNNNTLYPLLKKLELNNSLCVEVVPQDGKPAKKVYTITEIGKERLYALLKDFDERKGLSNNEFFYRVAFFQYLDKESIKKILDTREKALLSDITSANAMSLLSNMPDQASDIEFIHKFVAEQRQSNLEMVKELRKKYNIE